MEAATKDDKELKKISRKLYRLRKAKITSTGELLLPSGKIVGHRDYKRFYKQKLNQVSETPQEKVLRDQRMEISNMRMQKWLVAKFSGDANPNASGAMLLKQYKTLCKRIKMKADKINLNMRHQEKKRYVRLGQNTFRKYFVDRNLIFG